MVTTLDETYRYDTEFLREGDKGGIKNKGVELQGKIGGYKFEYNGRED